MILIIKAESYKSQACYTGILKTFLYKFPMPYYRNIKKKSFSFGVGNRRERESEWEGEGFISVRI